MIAYNVVLNRHNNIGTDQSLASTINGQLDRKAYLDPKKIIRFIEDLSLLDSQDRNEFCHKIDNDFYSSLTQPSTARHVGSFLSLYHQVVENEDYSWSYAETIARNMKTFFSSNEISNKDKAHALEIAIEASYRKNRYAAMDTCSRMIKSISDESLAMEVTTVLLRQRHTFIDEIQFSSCKSETIRNLLYSFKRPSQNLSQHSITHQQRAGI